MIFTQHPDKSLLKSWLCSPNSLTLFESKTANIPVYLARVDIQLTSPASHCGRLSIPYFKCSCLITCYLRVQPNAQTKNNYLESFSVEKQTPHERKCGWVLSVDVPALNNQLNARFLIIGLVCHFSLAGVLCVCFSLDFKKTFLVFRAANVNIFFHILFFIMVFKYQKQTFI